MATVGNKRYDTLQEAFKAAGLRSRRQSGVPVPSTVTLESSHYTVSTTLQIPERVEIIGQVPGTTLTFRDKGCIEVVSENSSVTFKGITFVRASESHGSITTRGYINFYNCSFISERTLDPKTVLLGLCGTLNLTGCLVRNAKVVLRKRDTWSNITDCIFETEECSPDGCAITSQGNLRLDRTKITNFGVGVSFDGSPGIMGRLNGVTIEARTIAVDIGVESLYAKACIFSCPTGCAVRVSGKAGRQTEIAIHNCEIKNSEIGLWLLSEANVKLEGSHFSKIKRVGICVESSSRLRVLNTSIEGNGETGTISSIVECGISVSSKSKATLVGTKVQGFNGAGIHATDFESKLEFSRLNIAQCAGPCVTVLDGAKIEGTYGTWTNAEFPSLLVQGNKTFASLTRVSLQSQSIGVSVKNRAKLDFTSSTVKDCKGNGIEVVAATVNATSSKFHSISEHGVSLGKGSTLSAENCTFKKCMDTGINVGHSSAILSLRACSFVNNKVGVSTGAGECSLLSCIFRGNTEFGLQLEENQKLQNRSLEALWCSFLQETSDGKHCNNIGFLNGNSRGLHLFGEYENELFGNILFERLQTAFSLHNSDDRKQSELAQHCLHSVAATASLRKGTHEKLVNRLANFPAVGVFSAPYRTAQFFQLFPLVDVVKSWRDIEHPDLLDEALGALDTALESNKLSVSAYCDLYEAAAEDCDKRFPERSIQYSDTHLLASAKVYPLRAWFLSLSARKSTVREEAFKLLTDPYVYRSPGALWVAHWMPDVWGEKFDDMYPKEGNSEFLMMWYDAMLDKGDATKVLEVFRERNHFNWTECMNKALQLVAYEALSVQNTIEAEAELKCFEKDANGFVPVLSVDFEEWSRGPLPGFIRRHVESASDVEDVFKFLLPIAHLDKLRHRDFILASVAHFFFPDSRVGPKDADNEMRLSCPICYAHRLPLWKSFSLQNCESGHRHCFECLIRSTSTAGQSMLGVCPGPCDTSVTRSDMELRGMCQEDVNRILRIMVSGRLNNIKGWQNCTVPGCLYGASKNPLVNGKCVMCQDFSDVIADSIEAEAGPTELDPSTRAIHIRLLQGVQAQINNEKGTGLFRECYHCAAVYEKGDACVLVTCSNCQNPAFHMSYYRPWDFGDREYGLESQRYAPKVKGILWKLGIFKRTNGKRLKLGKLLTQDQSDEVVRRANEVLKEYLTEDIDSLSHIFLRSKLG